jgi:pimeloyl-ACP methyl ester carboxylesterase
MGAEPWTDYLKPQHHIIVVKGNGEPFRPIVQRRPKRDGKWEYKVDLQPFGKTPEEQATNYKEYLKVLVSEIQNSGQDRVMVFIHGGMNFVKSSVTHAAQLVGRDEGRPSTGINSQGYPIFICWDSPPTGYWEQTLWVRAGKTEKYGRSGSGRSFYAWASMPFRILADAGRAVTRLPAQLFDYGYNDLYSIDQEKFTEFKNMKKETPFLRGETKNQEGKYLPPEKRIDVSNVEQVKKTSKHYVQDVATVLMFPVRGATSPVVDAIGVGAWNNMLRHTDTMFDRTNPDSNKHHTPVEEGLEKGETGAISMFLSALGDAGGSSRYKVTLIGHSMGAIVANRIIVSYPEFNYANIVYLAAACSVREFQNCVIPYLRRKPKSHFYGLSLHPRREAGEIAISPRNIGIDIAPRGSLLVWIDRIFGNPPSEDQRRFGIFQTAIVASHNIPFEARKQVTLKCFKDGADGATEDGIILSPQHHADFSRSPYWNSDFWQIDPPIPKNASQTAASGRTQRTAANR